MMTTAIDPPLVDPPITTAGAHSLAWSQYFVSVSDALSSVGVGTVAGDEATPGDVGEWTTASASGVGMASGAPINVVSLTLTAGDWDVWGNVSFSPAGATKPTVFIAGTSGSSGAFGTFVESINGAFIAGGGFDIGTGGQMRFNELAPVTVYLVAQSTFTLGGMTCSGHIFARRMQ